MKQQQSSEEFVNDLRRMHLRVEELEKQLADAINGKLPEDQQVDPSMIMVSSMVSSRTLEPMVMLRWFTFVAQIGLEQARDLAFNLLDAAEAAKSDAFLMQFMSKITDDPEAGPRRNRAMAAYADAVALFPGGDGTASMYRAAKAAGIEISDYRNNAH